jgi:hypothetical protein
LWDEPPTGWNWIQMRRSGRETAGSFGWGMKTSDSTAAAGQKGLTPGAKNASISNGADYFHAENPVISKSTTQTACFRITLF